MSKPLFTLLFLVFFTTYLILPDEYFNYETMSNVLKSAFPNCVFSDVVSYKNTYQRTLINYEIITNAKKEVSIISFCFSSLVLVGDSGGIGEEIAYPVYVDIYLKVFEVPSPCQ